MREQGRANDRKGEQSERLSPLERGGGDRDRRQKQDRKRIDDAAG